MRVLYDEGPILPTLTIDGELDLRLTRAPYAFSIPDIPFLSIIIIKQYVVFLEPTWVSRVRATRRALRYIWKGRL